MITPTVQRWRDGRDRYRPVGEPIDTHRYEVAAIAEDRIARAFVEREHYSRSYPAARFRFGLYRGGQLVGVAVLSQPMRDEVLSVLPGEREERVDLGRFVLADDVPANGETWMLGRCFDLLRAEGLAGVLSFSDPAPRIDAAGDVVFPGHIGTIYQAFNGVFLGRGTVRTLRVLPDGTVLSARAISKLRAGERGWRYVVELLERHGAPRFAGDRWTWGRAAIELVTRTTRHPGNLRYAWALRRRDRRHLPASLPYPKFGAQQIARVA